MIHSLLKTTEDVNSFNTMLLFTTIFIIVVIIVHIGLLMYFRIQAHKLYDEKRDNTKKLEDKKITNVEAKKITKQLDKNEHDIKLIDSKNNAEVGIFKIVMGILVATFTILALARAYFCTGIGGNISEIHKVSDVCNNGVCVEAYYTVKYNGVDQETMTIFVRNTLPVILSFEIFPQEGYRFEVESIEIKTNEETK